MPPAARVSDSAGNIERRVPQLEGKLDAIGEKVNELAIASTRQLERQSAVLEELSRTFREVADRLRMLETETKTTVATLTAKVDAAFRRIDDVRTDLELAKAARQKDIDDLCARATTTEASVPEKLRDRLEAIEKVLPSLTVTNRILAVVAGLLLTSVFGLLWALLTGQVVLIPK